MTVKEQLARLIDLKSIMTIVIILTISWMTITQIPIDTFYGTIAGMVVGFYFSKTQTPTTPTLPEIK